MHLIFTHGSSLLKKCTSLEVSLGKHLFSTSPFVLFRVWVANDQIWLTCLFVQFPVDHLTIYFFSSPCKLKLIKSDVWNSGILSRHEFDVNVILCIFCDLLRTTVVKLKTVSCFKNYVNLCFSTFRELAELPYVKSCIALGDNKPNNAATKGSSASPSKGVKGAKKESKWLWVVE